MTVRGEARDRHINVRMTTEERAAIMARSASFGMPPSTFMREAALHCDEKPVKVADTEELSAIRASLKKEGGLLNQLVRAAHIHGIDESLLPGLRTAISNVSASASDISKLLSEAADGGQK